jgi:hypothetical protein
MIKVEMYDKYRDRVVKKYPNSYARKENDNVFLFFDRNSPGEPRVAVLKEQPNGEIFFEMY